MHAIWMLVALAGMFGAIAFHHRKGRGTVAQIGEQLQARPSFPTDAWGSCERAASAVMMGRIVADEIGWPNSYFFPDDPLDIILYCPMGDGGEGLAISYNFEKEFGRECVFGDDRTFGEFVDRNFGSGPKIDAA